ncbi:MAG TPA: aspartate--tRNA(Asn) ligase [Candidatus Paceibacterota bacterium]|nr:aspartate--tRNA(Asn) ligase [Candidatus Paceibacterota bacterium]
MITRTPITTLKDKAGETVSVAGSISVRRDHGKLIFIDLRDVSSFVQMVVLPQNAEAYAAAQEIRPEWVIQVEGSVNKRPDKMIKADQDNGTVELEAKKITVLAKAKELPFELGAELNIDTLLDYRPLTLRDPKKRAIFKVQTEILKAYRAALDAEGFMEFQAPKIVGDDAEGGAGVFKVEYLKGKDAYLATSPQLYKQIMVGVFERVYTTGPAFRAEKHATSRHLNEIAMLDAEMGYIESQYDIMAVFTKVLRAVSAHVEKTCAKEFALLGATLPKAPENFPHMKLREAQKLITEATGEDCTKEPDLEPQHERWLCDYALKTFDSDFIFITHFPTTKRPFYTMEDPENPGYSKCFDLLFRGVEISSGNQRVHDYDALVAKMQWKGLDPEQFSFYLQAFKYGMPPHGGWGLGLERLTAKFLGIENVKEASLFPRDINRIDHLLTKVKGREDE